MGGMGSTSLVAYEKAWGTRRFTPFTTCQSVIHFMCAGWKSQPVSAKHSLITRVRPARRATDAASLQVTAGTSPGKM